MPVANVSISSPEGVLAARSQANHNTFHFGLSKSSGDTSELWCSNSLGH
jgi:hypothetical protein